jgi:hypothetical protein
MKLAHYRIFIISLVLTALLLGVKYILHALGWEIIPLDRLHSTVISGIIFVIGFILSATIRDYKEAERIPAEAAATLENISEDIKSIKENYPKFDLDEYQAQLRKVAKSLSADLRNSKSHTARMQLHELNRLNGKMEKAGVPANFIVKIKQQEASLTRHLYRVNYIQRITFIPSASILAWSIITIGIAMLMFTEMDSSLGGSLVTGAIIFILLYVSNLIQVIKTPFQDEGKTKDDVSLFLLEQTVRHLNENASKSAK